MDCTAGLLNSFIEVWMPYANAIYSVNV